MRENLKRCTIRRRDFFIGVASDGGASCPRPADFCDDVTLPFGGDKAYHTLLTV